MPYPRKFADVEQYERDRATLNWLSKQAERHAWTLVYAEFPDQVDRGSMALSDGWVLVRKPDYQDELRKHTEQCYGDAECYDAKVFIQRHLEARKRQEADQRKTDPFEKSNDDSSDDPRGLISALADLKSFAELRRHM